MVSAYRVMVTLPLKAAPVLAMTTGDLALLFLAGNRLRRKNDIPERGNQRGLRCAAHRERKAQGAAAGISNRYVSRVIASDGGIHRNGEVGTLARRQRGRQRMGHGKASRNAHRPQVHDRCSLVADSK